MFAAPRNPVDSKKSQIMEDVAFTLDSTNENLLEYSMDFDLIDELLAEGYWLETTDASNNLPSTESNQVNHNPFYNFAQEEVGNGIMKTSETASSSGESEAFQCDGSEVGRRWWIAPNVSPGLSSSVKQRLMTAVQYLKECTKDKDVLIQIWVPIQKGGRNVLTTDDQPYLYNSDSKNLASYRNVSSTFQFLADEDTKQSVGLPGRVFLGKLPEWTPDVRFFRSEEYPRIVYAQQYDVCGSLALPVFERCSGTCLGVVEIVTTSQKINYHPEIENVCKALEAVDLRSSQTFSSLHVKACSQSNQVALPWITEFLTSACIRFRLPLGLTWASCLEQGEEGSRHSGENYPSCVSTVDTACFVVDQHYIGFQEACSEHHLLRGQGIVGRAFMINRPCFATDITAFSKTEYPLAHHARMFGLQCAAAIPLVSSHTGLVDFVLEFFLPRECREAEEQNQMINSLSSFVQQAFYSSQKECRELVVFPASDVGVATSDERSAQAETEKFQTSFSKQYKQKARCSANAVEAQKNSGGVSVSWDIRKEPKEEFKVMTKWEETEMGLDHEELYREFQQVMQKSEHKSGDFMSRLHAVDQRKSVQRRRTKTEKTISLQVLRQYFAGSLKDAARSIGVCPTTLKRICRQHGISRWPSRKIKKVGHSLEKLQLIINSVKGAEGAIQISSFYKNFPELNSQKLPGSASFSSAKLGNPLVEINPETENVILSSGATTSNSTSSSCSQTSGSTTSCSTGMKQDFLTVHAVCTSSDPQTSENPSEGIKRTYSDAELNVCAQEEPKLLTRSQSHECLNGHAGFKTLTALHITKSQRPTSDGRIYRVKATFGEEKIRFSLQPNCQFRDLQREVAKRFNIDDIGLINLKYLDDDLEWVLLTCDADLEECVNVYKTSQDHVIRISIQQPSQHKPSCDSSRIQHHGYLR